MNNLNPLNVFPGIRNIFGYNPEEIYLGRKYTISSSVSTKGSYGWYKVKGLDEVVGLFDNKVYPIYKTGSTKDGVYVGSLKKYFGGETKPIRTQRLYNELRPFNMVKKAS